MANATLRVLPLGGLGEIGKNMTVVEYEDRIVVVDTGLMFPTPDQLGIDLVLPDFKYLRDRAADIEAIFLTHGHEDHVGALPFVLREMGGDLPPVYGGPLTIEMVRSKLDEHRLKGVDLEPVAAGETIDAGPFSAEMVKMAHSIPDACAVALTCELGTTLVTGDYKFDQTPVDGVPADVSRLAELGREGRPDHRQVGVRGVVGEVDALAGLGRNPSPFGPHRRHRLAEKNDAVPGDAGGESAKGVRGHARAWRGAARLGKRGVRPKEREPRPALRARASARSRRRRTA